MGKVNLFQVNVNSQRTNKRAQKRGNGNYLPIFEDDHFLYICHNSLSPPPNPPPPTLQHVLQCMLKNGYEDHLEQCSKEKGTCTTCNLDITVVDTWNDVHRGSTILRQNHGKSLKTIIDENGWQTDRDNGNFFFLIAPSQFIAVKCKWKYQRIYS